MKRAILMLMLTITGAVAFAQTQDRASEKDARQLSGFERDWTTATLNRDQTWLGKFFAGKLMVVPTEEDKVKNRVTEIAGMIDRAIPAGLPTPRDAKVRITGNVTVLGASASGEANPSYFFLDTFNKHNGKWEVIATHFSSASEPLSGETDEQEILRMEREWSDALAKGDAAALDRIFADVYIMTNSFGEVKTKAAWMTDFSTGHAANEANVIEEVKVSFYGDTAILTGRVSRKGQSESRDKGGEFRITHVYVKRQERWQVVANQITAITKQ